MVNSIAELDSAIRSELAFTDEDMNQYILFEEHETHFTVKYKRWLPPSMGGLKLKDFLVEKLGAKYEKYPKAKFTIERRKAEAPNSSTAPKEQLVPDQTGPQPAITFNDSVTMPIRMVKANQLHPHPKWHTIYDEHKDDVAFDESIRKFGILKPLDVNPNFTILNGHRRWKRANRLGIKQVPIQVRSFPDETVAMIELNRYRKKTAREIYNEIKALEGDLKPKAQAKQEATQFGNREESDTALSNLTTPQKPIHVRDEAAKKVGVSSGHAFKIKEIFEKENKIPEVIKQLDKGTITVHQAHQKLRATENPKAPKDFQPSEPIDTGMIFHCDVCDQDFSIIHVNKNYHKLQKAKVI